MGSVVIPFGKYKDRTLDEVPLRYLAWLLTKYKGYRIPRKDIEDEALSRGCEKRDGVWGIEVPQAREWQHLFDSEEVSCDFLGNVISRTYRDDWDDDPDCMYNYEGIPNSY